MRILTSDGVDIPYDQSVIVTRTSSDGVMVVAIVRGSNYTLGWYRTAQSAREAREKLEQAYCEGKNYYDMGKEMSK